MEDEIFPTHFASSLGEECKLLVKHKRGMDHVKYVKRNIMMQSFQQMAMANPFDECLIAFHGVVLKKKHKENLEIIYKSTRTWTLGRATTILMKKLESPTLSGRDAKELNTAIIEHIKGDQSEGNKSGAPRGQFNIYGTFADK